MKSPHPSVAYVSPLYFPFIGGAEVSLSRLIQGIDSSGKIKVSLFTNLVDTTGAILPGGENIQGNIHRLGSPEKIPVYDSQKWSRQTIDNAKKLIKQHLQDIDIIYLNNDRYLRETADIEWFAMLKKPIIVKMIFDSSIKRLESNVKLFQKMADENLFIIHCLTPEIVQDCINAGFKKKHCVYIPNPLDTSKFKTSATKKEVARKSLNIAKNKLVYIFTGRLSPQKNIEGLIELFNVLKENRTDSELLIVGDCNHPEYELIIRKLKEHNQNDIRWIGRVSNSDINQYLWAADVFLLASKFEGLSNSLLEAMATGLCPVVEENISGVKNIIKNKKGGFLYDWNNLQKLQKEFDSLGKKQIMKSGRLSLKVIKEKCDLKKVIPAHVLMYKKLYAINK